MVKAVWTGAAQAVAQVDTVTIAGTIAAGEDFSITINSKAATYTTVSGDGTAQVATGLEAACEALTSPEFTEIEWTVSGSVVTAKNTVAGVPFSFAVSTTSAMGTITRSTVTSASSPNHWDAAGNWSTGAVPVAADEWFVDDEDAEILYGLPTAGTLFAAVTIKAGQLGLPDQNPLGYGEYRTKRATFGATTMSIGTQGGGPSLVRADLGAAASTVVVRGTAGTQAGAAVDLLINHASSTVAVIGGTCGIAFAASQTSTLGAVHVGPNGDVELGDGVTVATVTNAGTLRMACGATTLNVEAGRVDLTDAGAIATVELRGGTINHRSSGTITTANLGPGVFDLSGDVRERTITNCTLRKDGVIQDPYNAGTFTNGIQLDSGADQLAAR